MSALNLPSPPSPKPRVRAKRGPRQITESSELHYMVTPRVLAVGREYFGCPLLDGIPLEEGSSGEGSAFSHWNDRALKGEVLCAFGGSAPGDRSGGSGGSTGQTPEGGCEMGGL